MKYSHLKNRNIFTKEKQACTSNKPKFIGLKSLYIFIQAVLVQDPFC